MVAWYLATIMLTINMLTSSLLVASAESSGLPFAMALYTRHLLQSFPSGVGPDQEASVLLVVNSALELQRISCTSTSDCFSGASCINGLCTCQSPLVEDHEQCRSSCSNYRPHLCGGRCYSDAGAQHCDSNCGGGLCITGGPCIFSSTQPNRCGAPLSCPAGQQSCQTSSTTTACQAVTTGNCSPGCFGSCPTGTSCQLPNGGCSTSAVSPPPPPPPPPPPSGTSNPSPSPIGGSGGGGGGSDTNTTPSTGLIEPALSSGILAQEPIVETPTVTTQTATATTVPATSTSATTAVRAFPG